MNKLMKLSFTILIIISSILFLDSCKKDENMIPIPMTEQFELNLSTYNIFQGDAQDLLPSDDYHLLELQSSLFVNYAEKQRLVKMPEGTQMIKNGNGIPVFPEGTILVKTFYYFNDARDPSLGKQLIETRLLIKTSGFWNVAAYVWNDSQTEAVLRTDGFDKQVSWINEAGSNRSVTYHVPDQGECVSCHQVNEEVVPLGPTLRNMNFDVIRNSASINQLHYFQSLNLINDFDVIDVSEIVDYNNLNASLSQRGRAYLEMNCAHCHNPAAWSKPADKGYDFRYETQLSNTRILDKKEKIKDVFRSGEMPYLGNTILDQEGLVLLTAYINSL